MWEPEKFQCEFRLHSESFSHRNHGSGSGKRSSDEWQITSSSDTNVGEWHITQNDNTSFNTSFDYQWMCLRIEKLKMSAVESNFMFDFHEWGHLWRTGEKSILLSSFNEILTRSNERKRAALTEMAFELTEKCRFWFRISFVRLNWTRKFVYIATY